MSQIPLLDYDNMFITRDQSDFMDESLHGFAEVEFLYPEGVYLPCLPVNTDRGLVYPRSGSSTCTSYELQLTACY